MTSFTIPMIWMYALVAPAPAQPEGPAPAATETKSTRLPVAAEEPGPTDAAEPEADTPGAEPTEGADPATAPTPEGAPPPSESTDAPAGNDTPAPSDGDSPLEERPQGGGEAEVAPRPPPPTASPAPPAEATVSRRSRTWPDRPIRWRLDALVGVGSTLVADQGFLAFDDDQELLGFDVGARFDYRLGQRFFLGGGAQYSRTTADRDVYDGLFSTELTVHEPTVHARGSLMTIEGIDVFADLGGGPTIALDSISTQQQAANERRSVTGTFSVTGGVSLYLPKKWLRRRGSSRVTAGLETGVGYLYRGNIDFATDPILDEDPLPTSTTNYGDLSMSGFVWRVGLIVRVM